MKSNWGKFSPHVLFSTSPIVKDTNQDLSAVLWSNRDLSAVLWSTVWGRLQSGTIGSCLSLWAACFEDPVSIFVMFSFICVSLVSARTCLIAVDSDPHLGSVRKAHLLRWFLNSIQQPKELLMVDPITGI